MYITISQLRKRKPTIFILNICVCLIVVYITFLTGIQNTSDKTLCDATAIILQYSLLAFWCWNGANSYNLYMMVVKVFSSDDLVLCRLYTLCYGIPLLIVGINVGSTLVSTDLALPAGVSNYRLESRCWLKDYSLTFGFLVPMAIVLLFNII
uniref:G-protein coupled receptors family 2 profile 2 domain-containing protein n=1 Tax=Ciona savignyi TaxID=51511 RepID=H2YIL3_CIOSA